MHLTADILPSPTCYNSLPLDNQYHNRDQVILLNRKRISEFQPTFHEIGHALYVGTPGTGSPVSGRWIRKLPTGPMDETNVRG